MIFEPFNCLFYNFFTLGKCQPNCTKRPFPLTYSASVRTKKKKKSQKVRRVLSDTQKESLWVNYFTNDQVD